MVAVVVVEVRTEEAGAAGHMAVLAAVAGARRRRLVAANLTRDVKDLRGQRKDGDRQEHRSDPDQPPSHDTLCTKG